MHYLIKYCISFRLMKRGVGGVQCAFPEGSRGYFSYCLSIQQIVSYTLYSHMPSLFASTGFGALPAFSACEDENSTGLSVAILIHAEADCFPPTVHYKFYRSLLVD